MFKKLIFTVGVIFNFSIIGFPQDKILEKLAEIKILRTNIAELEKHYPVQAKYPDSMILEFQGGFLDVRFANKACDRGFDVKLGTIISLDYLPGDAVFTVADIGLDRKKFVLRDTDGDVIDLREYVNEQDGIRVVFSIEDETIESIYLTPPPSVPESQKCRR